MKSPTRSLLAFLAVLAIISVWYLNGVTGVPFHPDESTQLFTSMDADLFWKQLPALFWNPHKEGDLRQRYRELDAPLTHSLIAAGRWIAGQLALAVDWDWGKTWQENNLRGALPTQGQLLAGRYGVAALFPFSVLFLFLAARRVSSDFTAWTAALLLASNTLVLLHTRRAMAEGALLCTTVFLMWALVRFERFPWLSAVPAALAFCAKQTLGALIPVSLLAAVWQVSCDDPLSERLKRGFRNMVLFGAVLLVVIALLNPFLWERPLEAAQAALRARQALVTAQSSDRPAQALNTPGKKIIGLLGSLYLTPPQFAETGNYAPETHPSEEIYLANPLHSLLRTTVGGGILLALGIFGLIAAIRQAFTAPPEAKRRLALLLAATVALVAALFLLVPLPWQRYYLPLVPFACLWSALGLDQIRAQISLAIRRGKVPASRENFPST